MVGMYTPKKFAELVGVSTRTLRRWKKSEKLVPIIDEGKDKTFYSEEQIDDAKALLAENAQILPSEKIVIPLDKNFQGLFNPKYHGATRNIIEDKRLKIITNVKLSGAATSFNQFDKLVFCAAISEYLAGNEVFTLRSLWHKIGGGWVLTDEMKKKFSDSIERLACTRIEIDMTAVNEKHHYTDDKKVVLKGYLLPCESIEVKVNGQVTDGAYKFLNSAVLMEVAKLKKQFAEQPIELLDVPKVRNTESNLKIKSYLLERVTSINGSQKPRKTHISGKKKGGGFNFKRTKKLKNSILMKTLREQCEISDADDKQAREIVAKVMDHFKKKGTIDGWNFENGVGGKTRAVKFEPPKKK